MKEDNAAFDSDLHENLFNQAILEYMEAKRSGTADRNDFVARFAAVAI